MRRPALYLPLLGLLLGCNPIPIHHACSLPYLQSDLALESIVQVSTSSYFSHKCPVPIAKRSLLRRDWGVLHLTWHGTPHRLWMRTESSQGLDLHTVGEGVAKADATFLGERHTAVKRFEGPTSVDADVSTEFQLTILDADERVLDQIQLTYRTLKCTCATYDSI